VAELYNLFCYPAVGKFVSCYAVRVSRDHGQASQPQPARTSPPAPVQVVEAAVGGGLASRVKSSGWGAAARRSTVVAGGGGDRNVPRLPRVLFLLALLGIAPVTGLGLRGHDPSLSMPKLGRPLLRRTETVSGRARSVRSAGTSCLPCRETQGKALYHCLIASSATPALAPF
jgi:hypothetical protein